MRVAQLLLALVVAASAALAQPIQRSQAEVRDEYKEVFDVATRSEKLLMELTYRTLQRPESDIILWDMSVVSNEVAGRFLRFKQNKTGRQMVIAMSPDLDALIPRPAGNVRKLKEPLVKRLDGEAYSYDGLSSMLKRSIAAANKLRKARGIDPMPPFGYRDLKGKGATDMWLDKQPIEQIQALLGHANKSTTEIYIKQRYRQAVEPNKVVMA